MALLTCGDLRFAYQWPDDWPTGGAGAAQAAFPGTTALNRDSGPAVLGFVNQVAALSAWTDPALGRKVEAMLRAMPPHVHSQQQAYAWVATHWNTFAG